MRRALVLVALLALAAPATAADRDAPWRLTGISKDQRTLKLVYQGSGCLLEDGRPVVEATATRVTIRVRQTVVEPKPYEGCAYFLAAYRLDVRLRGPLAGRAVRGGPRFTTTGGPGSVPRVVGLRRRDAVRALRSQGFGVRVRGKGTGVVRSQTPPPGTRAKRQGLEVTLRVR